jgi:hypothetical protein
MIAMPLRKCGLTVACGVSLLIGVTGCGNPGMAKVSGTVTFRGTPVPDAVVQFLPTSKPGAGGRTDAEGRFSLTTLKPGDGAYVGQGRVTITPYVEWVGSDNPRPLSRPRPDIPERYRTPDKTPLTAEVVAGRNNVIQLELDEGDSKTNK